MLNRKASESQRLERNCVIISILPRNILIR